MSNFATDPRFLGSIRRHFVSLGGTVHDLKDGQPIRERPFACSGFVVEIRGVWCFVTAGHVFTDIDSGVQRGELRVLKCGFADYFSAEARVKESTPIDYHDIHKIFVNHEATGLDIGIIALRDIYRAGMEANGIRPIAVVPWIGREPPRFDDYALLGLPLDANQSVEREGPRGPQIGNIVTLTLVGVDALIPTPIKYHSSVVPRFVGRLRDNGELKSVKGMSGGPLLGVNPTYGDWDYGCVAVQSGWLPESRVVLGTPMGIVVENIERLLDKSEGK